MSDAAPRRGKSLQRRSAARLAAVQALYQAGITGADPDDIIADFVEHEIGAFAFVDPQEEGDEEVKAALCEPDRVLFADIVRGALAGQRDFDAMADAALTPPWNPERLEEVVRAILRAGIYELVSRATLPPKVTISEYVDIGRAFYAGVEPALINAVLDRVARQLRPAEFGGAEFGGAETGGDAA